MENLKVLTAVEIEFTADSFPPSLSECKFKLQLTYERTFVPEYLLPYVEFIAVNEDIPDDEHNID